MNDNYYSINWTELYGGKPIPIQPYEPDPNTSHENYYYNSSENKLYKLSTITDCTNKNVRKRWVKLSK